MLLGKGSHVTKPKVNVARSSLLTLEALESHVTKGMNDVCRLQERNKELGTIISHRENCSEGKMGKVFSEILLATG